MFDAYKVAVKLSLTNHISTGLALITSELGGVSKALERAQIETVAFENSLRNIKKLGLIGGGMAAAGFGMLSLLKGPLHEAKEWQTEVTRFKALGLGEHANADAAKFARGMNIMGSSARDNMKLLREATAIMGDLHHAEQVLPTLAKMKFGLQSVMGGEHGSNFEQMFQAALKTTELRGSLINRVTGEIDGAKFTGALNMMTQAYVASGGLVKPQDYLAAMKTGGVSTKLMNDEMFFFGLGHFMQESGGSRTGTASMSMFQNWMMGHMPQRVAEDMAKVGLLQKSALHYGKTGHITKVDTEGIINSDLFAKNPFKWVNSVVVPKLKAQGLEGDKLNLKLAGLLGIRTASNLADQFVREEKVANLYVDRAHKASDVDKLYKLGGDTLEGKQIDLHAKWANVLNNLGTAVLPMAIKGVTFLTSSLNAFSKFAEANPGKVKVLTVAFAALGTALALGGTVLLATAGLKGLGLAFSLLKSPAIAMVGRALVWLANAGLWAGRLLLANPIGLILTGIAVAGFLIYKNWSTIGPYLTKVWEVVKYIALSSFEWIWSKLKAVFEFVKPVIDFYINAWTKIFTVIKDGVMIAFDFISNLVSRLWDKLKNSAIGRFLGAVGAAVNSTVSNVGSATSAYANQLYANAVAYNRAHDAPNNERRHVGPPPQAQSIVVNSAINLDGKKIAESTTKYQAKGLAGPQSGASQFDGNFNMRWLSNALAGG